MFTGIVSAIGKVRSAQQRGDLRLVVETEAPLADLTLGASIACSGVCLTVVDKGPDWFAVDLSAETVSKTARDLWRQGSRLNLERALRMGDELGGHLVTGHVDAVADVVNAAPSGDSLALDVCIPRSIGAMVAAKGSITLDGVSLTVNSVSDEAHGTIASLNIIPHTAASTTLGEASLGRKFNVEIDVLARYLDRMMTARSHSD